MSTLTSLALQSFSVSTCEGSKVAEYVDCMEAIKAIIFLTLYFSCESLGAIYLSSISQRLVKHHQPLKASSFGG